jgi:hypothetical protein
LQRTLISGGIAAAVIGALLTWWLSGSPNVTATNCGIAVGGGVSSSTLTANCPAPAGR